MQKRIGWDTGKEEGEKKGKKKKDPHGGAGKKHTL